MTDTSRWTDPEFDDSPAAIAARLATRRAAIRKAYDPSEPRDDHGMWSTSGGDGAPRTIPNTGAQTPFASLPAKYTAAADKAMAKLGLTREILASQLQSVLSRGDPSHAQWYSQVHDAAQNMADHYGISIEQTAGIIAAMSPARDFGKNMGDAGKLIDVMARNEPFTPTQENLDAYNSRRDPKDVIALPGTYKPSDLDPRALVGLHPILAKLGNSTGLDGPMRGIAIYRGATADQILGGPKVRSFNDNILDPHGRQGQEVTIDTWMYRAMTPPDHQFPNYQGQTLRSLEANNTDRLEFNKAQKELPADQRTKYDGPMGKRTQDVYQSTPGKLVGTDIPSNTGLYPVFADVVREVAAANNMTPAGAQAVAWEVARQDAGYKATDLEKVLGPWMKK